MKKILSLAIFIATTSVFAQPYTETFDAVETNSTSYGTTGSFTGVEGIEYQFKARTDMATFQIDGQGIMLRKVSDNGYIMGTYTNGLSKFGFQYRQAYGDTSPRKLEVQVRNSDGTFVELHTTPDPEGGPTDVTTYVMPSDLLTDYNVANKEVVIRIVLPSTTSGNKQTVIDNIVWAPYDPSVSVKNNEIEGLQVYPNPATNVVNISSDANALKEVAIFDLTGKKVLETETMNSVNVSSLNAGVYMLQVEENGKKSSRKLVIK